MNPVNKILSIYSVLFKHYVGFNYRTAHGKDQTIIKNLLKSYSEDQLTALLIIYFNWYGMSGSDEKEQQFVASTGFALSMFMAQTVKYEMYARNVAGLDMDNEEALKVFIAKHMQEALG